ncbi:MAG TPA: hypothetical protein VD931_11510 [Baekduia sp.]|nr:hypothetical protein [Baekduia sp.]
MTDPVVAAGVERLLLRQLAQQLATSALPESTSASGGAAKDLFATVLADAVAGPEAPRR